MNGYGSYYFASGSVYMGEWSNGKANGKVFLIIQGLYEFQNGAQYDGDWENHKMHGEGLYVDAKGNKWEGEFVDGVY